jgi:hypothetical protein
MIIAKIILVVLSTYLSVGLLFGLAFIIYGAPQIDQMVRGTSWRFRLLLWPGAAALWPWLALRWYRGS